MTVVDLVGSSRGDVTGLAALAARLRRASTALTAADDVAAVLDAARAVDLAADRLRALPSPPAADAVLEVERALVSDLGAPLAVLTREGNR